MANDVPWGPFPLNSRAMTTNNHQDPLQFAAETGNIAEVKYLLQDSRVDPADDENYAILLAAKNGHLAILECLLQDKRVNPSGYNNYAIKFSAENGHIAVVERLLQDPRVNPSVDRNYAIKSAAEHGYVNVVATLYTALKRSHPETIPALQKHEAIQFCFRAKSDAYLVTSSLFRQKPSGMSAPILATLEQNGYLCKYDADKIRQGNPKPNVEVQQAYFSTCVML